jgi:outer membrane protein insertion porin family
LEAQYFRSLIPDADVVGELKVQAGNITGLGQPVRVLDNFFKGGETIRGFAPYGYGPRETTSGLNTPVGGKNFWAATAEVQFPMPGAASDFGLRGAVFADAGQLFGVDVPVGGAVTSGNSLRSSVGASILWASPIGILRGDFAYPITKDPADKTQLFHFSAGKQF